MFSVDQNDLENTLICCFCPAKVSDDKKSEQISFLREGVSHCDFNKNIKPTVLLNVLGPSI